jgi:hypothetical protein
MSRCTYVSTMSTLRKSPRKRVEAGPLRNAQPRNPATRKLTKSPKGKWTHYARPCQLSDDPDVCET